MFPCLRGQETITGETFFASEKQQMFLTFFRNVLFLQQIFPRLRAEEPMFCATVFPRLQGTYDAQHQCYNRQRNIVA